jgi:hypothetical protein
MTGSDIRHSALSRSDAQAISNMTVARFRQHIGRGPTKARTHGNEDAANIAVQTFILGAESKRAVTTRVRLASEPDPADA